MFIICWEYVQQMSIDLMKENGFSLKKTRSRWHPREIKTDTDYADDQMLLTNAPTQTKSQMYRLE